MRVGILTVPFNNNYGGYLQCFALMSTLRKLGHQPVIINRRPNLNLPLLNRIKAFVANELLGDRCRMYNKKSMEAYYAMKGSKMHPFVKHYLKPMTQPLYKANDYAMLESLDLDAVVVGSDQVWRPQYVPEIEEYYLKYVPSNIRKIAYAASLGSDKVEYSEAELKECSSLLQSFYTVSTREKSGQKIVAEYLGRKDTKVVLDPTMLLVPEEYQAIKGGGCICKKKHVFAYILDRTQWKRDAISHMESYYRCSVLDIMNIERSEPFFSIEKWLNELESSDFVITDSFHGTVFCILFNRPFYVIGNEKRGNSRMEDLLSMFGLEDRLLNEGTKESNKIEFKDDIEWKNVNEKLNELRKESIDFLKQSLV